jgi:hypothetical protein
MAETLKPEIIDNPAVGEFYANRMIAATFDGGAVVITLGSARYLPGQDTKASKKHALPPVHVTARLALSPGGAMELANALNAMLKTLREMQQKAAAAKTGQPN